MSYHYAEFVNYDEKAQLASAFNLIRGEGLTEKKYFSQSPDTAFYDHIQRWPPGFAVTITPLLLLFNKNEFLATLCLDIIAGIAFIFLIAYACRLLSASRPITNIAILIAGCFQYYIFILSYPCDHIAFIFLLWGLLEGVKVLHHSKRLSLFRVIATSILFALPTFFRYMYLPVSILLPVLLITFSLTRKNTTLRFNGACLFIGTVLSIALLYGWTKFYSGQFSYIVKTEKGIFPEQLLHWYPFIPSAFINIESFQSYISQILDIGYTDVLHFLEGVNFLFIVGFSYVVYSFIRKQNLKTYLENFQFFILSGMALSVLIVGLLGYLSMTNRPQVYWNYNIEGRYFIFPVVFVQLAVLIKSSLDRSTSKSSFTKYFQQALIFLLLFSSIHGMFSTFRNMSSNKNNPFSTKHYMDYRPMMKIFNEIKKKYNNREILVTSPNEYFLYAANNVGFKPIYDYDTINSVLPAVSKSSVLITILNDIDTSYMSKYISERK